MAGEHGAEISIEVGGADEAIAQAQKIGSTWASAGEKIESSFGRAVGKIGQGMTSIAEDAIRVATAVNTISLGQAVSQARAYDEAIARMSVSAGQSAEQLKAKLGAIAKVGLMRDEDAQALSKALGRATYDAKGAVNAITGLNDEAVATGRSAQELAPLGVALHNTLGVTGDTREALGKMRAEADALGTVGGPMAFQDLFLGITGQIDQVSDKIDGARDKAMAFAGVLTKGLKPQAAQRVAQGALGSLESNANDISRTLGHDVLDDEGHIKDPTQVIRDLKKSMARRGLSKRQQLLAWRRFAGNEAGSRIFAGGDFSEVEGLKNTAPSTGAALAQQQFAQSAAGQRLARTQQQERDMRSLGEHAGGANDWWNSMFAGHPLLQQGANMLVGGAARAGLGKAASFFGGLGGGGGGGGAGAGGAAGAAEGAGADVGAGFGAAALPVAAMFATVLGTGATLSQLGAASKLKQGFMTKALTGEEAASTRDAAAEAERDGASIRSTGSFADVIGAERAMQERQRRARGASASTALPMADQQREDPLMKQAIDLLMRQGSSRANAEETAKALSNEIHSKPLRVVFAGFEAPPSDSRGAQ